MGIDDEGSDAQVVARSLRSPSMFAVLFDRHASLVHGYARRRAGSEVADDVMSQTFLVAFDKRHRYDPSHPDARPWLLGIATRLLARHARTESRRWAAYGRVAAQRPHHVDLDVEAISARLDAQSQTGELARTLAALNQRDRDVLLLYGFADLTYEQIAHALQIPVGTVRSRLNRARRLMRSALTEAAGPEEPPLPAATGRHTPGPLRFSSVLTEETGHE